MNLNEHKTGQMSLSELKGSLMSLFVPKQAQIFINFVPAMHVSIRYDMCDDF